MRKILAILAVTVLFPLAARAAEPGLPVPVQTVGGIRYYNGGVGIDERTALPQIYPLKIVLATDRGHYLNDAEIVISGSDGREVLRVRANRGPWLVTDVPPGTYSIEASLEGQTATSSVTVPRGGRQVRILRWKTTEIDMGL